MKADAYETIRMALEAQTSILFGVSKLPYPPKKERLLKTKILLASACSTSYAIHTISKDYSRLYLEQTMLGRSLLEKLVNFLYLQFSSDTELERFLLHPFYKTYHSMQKTKYTTNTKLSVIFKGQKEYKKLERVKRALEIFSATNPRMGWSKKSLHQKISYIENNSTMHVEALLLANLSIYANASESLHGSLYGCSYHTNAYLPINIDLGDNILKNSATDLMTHLSLITLSLNFICAKIHSEKKLKTAIDHNIKLATKNLMELINTN